MGIWYMIHGTRWYENEVLSHVSLLIHRAESGLGLWEETFDGHPDSKPDGPTSVGMDVYFPGERGRILSIPAL